MTERVSEKAGCPKCGNAERLWTRNWYHGPNYRNSRYGGRLNYRCNQCGFVWSEPAHDSNEVE